ncbi:phosphate acyltransferase PlsX [bacterium]|nr:phosphate acyltransferase PlsX [bacterium]
MPIAVDAMGGDFYPHNPVAGAIKAVKEKNISIILVGDEDKIMRELDKYRFNPNKVEVIHAKEMIEMEDHVVTALRRKKESSMHLCFKLHKTNQVDGVVSAGNSGAMLAIGHYILKTVPGINRPCISALLPSKKEKVLLVDAGANTDCSAETMLQFALLGSLYMQEIHLKKNPRIGLLNIGSEEGKGDERSQRAYQLLKASSLNFIGNVEGQAFFNGDVDVVVSDGFAGNILLKSVQGAADFVSNLVRGEIKHSFLAKIGALFMLFSLLRLKKQTNYAEFGGAPLLGLKGNTIICHGRSNPQAIAFAIKFSQWSHETHLVEKIQESILKYEAMLKQIA